MLLPISRNPYLFCRHYEIHLPFLDFLYHQPRLRRLLVFLWMCRASISVRVENLSQCLPYLPPCRAWGWNFILMTPLASISLSWKHPVPEEWETLVTGIGLAWKPYNWWNVADGEKALEHEWRKVWSRWREKSVTVRTQGGGWRRIGWLEKVEE
jgi:hypothetical protein